MGYFEFLHEYPFPGSTGMIYMISDPLVSYSWMKTQYSTIVARVFANASIYFQNSIAIYLK